MRALLNNQPRIVQGLPEFPPSFVDIFGKVGDHTPLEMDSRVSPSALIRMKLITSILEYAKEHRGWKYEVTDQHQIYSVKGYYLGLSKIDKLIIKLRKLDCEAALVARICIVEAESNQEIDLTSTNHLIHSLLKNYWPHLLGSRRGDDFNLSKEEAAIVDYWRRHIMAPAVKKLL